MARMADPAQPPKPGGRRNPGTAPLPGGAKAVKENIGKYCM